MLRFKLLLAIALFAVLNPCVWAADESSPCTAPEGVGYFPADDDSRPTVIVFVHGVLGDSTSTWVHTPFLSRFGIGSPVFWPCLIRRDRLFDTASLFLFGFASNAFDPSPSMAVVTKKLYAELSGRGIFERHTHVVFVAHSMGGLIVSQMLLDRLNVQQIKLVRAVLFFGTPGQGADIARVAESGSDNIQFAELADANALKSWSERWVKTTRTALKSYCAAETRRVSWLPWKDLVVPPESASALCGGASDPIFGKDHLGLVKPESPGDEPFRVLFNQYARCVAPYFRLGDQYSETQTLAGQELGSWLHGLQATVVFDDTSVATIKTMLYARPSMWGKDHYLSPKPGDPGFDLASTETSDANGFAIVFRDQFKDRLRDFELESMVLVRNLDKVVGHRALVDLRDGLITNGTLQPDDFALVLRDKHQASRKVLMFANAASTLVEASQRLKGFVPFDQSSGCL